MTPERWAKIEAVFHQALECDPSDRAAFLDRECAADPDLRREVESLLKETDIGEESFRREFLQGAAEAIGTRSQPPVRARARPTWWMSILIVSILLNAAFIFYVVIVGPSEIRGTVVRFANGAMQITSVDADSLPARSGLQIGDRVLSIDGRPMRVASDWTAATGTWKKGFPHEWLVERGERRITLHIVPEPATIRGRLAEGYMVIVFHTFSGLFVGLLVAWKRPSDPLARVGAWFLLTASIAFGLTPGWAAVWRELPAIVQLPLWIGQISRFVLEGIFLSFFVLFPRRLFAARWPWFLIWIPVLATLPWRVAGYLNIIYPEQHWPVPPWILQAGFLRTIVYLLAGVAILVINYRGLLDVNEKRRVRVLMVGTGVSVIGAAILVWVDSFYSRNLNFQGWLILTGVFPLISACFFSLAYAILRHRVLEVRVIVRQGLQYAAARGIVLGLVPALGLLLAIDLVVSSQEPLATIMQTRGWIYLSVAGAALAVHWKRKEWLAAIDHGFFRERYDARQVLSGVVEEIRAARGIDRVAGLVVRQIESALHPEFVALMIQEPGQQEFRAVAVAPAVADVPSTLPAESKLVGLARVLGKPIELLTDTSWLEKRLPAIEIEMFKQDRIDLVVPVESLPNDRQVLLILGMRKSEERYSSEDQELLQAIAGGLSLLLLQPTPTVTMFNECPDCGLCYETNTTACRHEGAHLLPVNLPRLLSRRYRLERRRGRGGMGTVYEAVDTALDRRVAVKVIRDELLGSSDAAQRFQREAKTSAAFSHPNVVTIHDYSVEGSRAFLVMELLEGKTVREELAERRRLEPARIVEILRDVCSAVDAAHRRHLIHRDLKPENIFLTRGSAKVLDFGIAKFLGTIDGDAVTQAATQTRSGVLIGTFAYMSPEQLMGGDPNVLWDLWALAVVTYEMLTGTLPFPRGTAESWRHAIVKGSFIPIAEHFAEPNARWIAFFTRTLAPDCTMRPQTAAEFLSALEQAFL
jgi:tRNA A-37 threonylcarbamoyl transferase component Bud32